MKNVIIQPISYERKMIHMKTLTIIPLATPKTITVEAVNAIRNANILFVQTMQHPCANPIRELCGAEMIINSIDDLYEKCEDFDELNRCIADRLTSGESCAYAVLGRGISRELMNMLHKYAHEREFALRVLPSSGYAEAALSAAVNAGHDADLTEYRLIAASNLAGASSDLMTDHELVIEEVDTLLRAGEVKLVLSEYYPAELELTLCTMNENGEYEAEACPLYQLDQSGNAAKFDAATVIILPPCALMERERHGLDGLMEVMYRLRAPGGCPWDAEQTHESLRSSLIEESYEVLDAIDREDIPALEEELGDLLLQVVFHAVIEQERSEFNMRDVITGIVNKLIYRHPHVFGNLKVSGSEDVLVNWENLKKKEKHQSTVADAMRSVPSAFPALIRSYKIQKKAAHVGFDWSNAVDALPKVSEEAGEVLEAIKAGDHEHIMEEIGDLLFACVNVSRLIKVDPELALKAATDKFMERFIEMEGLILADGMKLEDMCLAEMDIYWDRVKKQKVTM